MADWRHLATTRRLEVTVETAVIVVIAAAALALAVGVIVIAMRIGARLSARGNHRRGSRSGRQPQ